MADEVSALLDQLKALVQSKLDPEVSHQISQEDLDHAARMTSQDIQVVIDRFEYGFRWLESKNGGLIQSIPQASPTIAWADPDTPVKYTKAAKLHNTIKDLPEKLAIYSHQKLPLLEDGHPHQPKCIEIDTKNALTASALLRRMVEEKKKKKQGLRDPNDQICRMPSKMGAKTKIDDFTIFVDGLLDSKWIKRQDNYDCVEHMDIDKVWKLFRMWGCYLAGDRNFGWFVSDIWDVIDLNDFGKFLGLEFEKGFGDALAAMRMEFNANMDMDSDEELTSDEELILSLA